MNHLERFYATIERRAVDRPATWLGLPVAAAQERLYAHFGVASARELTEALDDDVWPVELPYHSPTSDAIYAAFDWAQAGQADLEHRTLTTPGWFAGETDPARVAEFDWPEPARTLLARVESHIAAESDPELARAHLVRGRAELSDLRVPAFMEAFLALELPR